MHPAMQAARSRYLEFFEATNLILTYARLTIEALDMLQTARAPIERLKQFDRESDEYFRYLQAAMGRQQDIEFLAQNRDHGERLVSAQAMISMWSALEAFIDDLLVAIVRGDRTLLTEREVPKIQLSLSEYMAFQDDDERAEHLVEQVKQKHKLSPGIGVFEPLLSMFGFGGAVDPQVRRDILDFWAVRNCVVHRAAVVDRKFIRAYPTSNLALGDRVVVTIDDCYRYHHAVAQYGAEVVARVAARYAPDDPAFPRMATQLLDFVKRPAAPEV